MGRGWGEGRGGEGRRQAVRVQKMFCNQHVVSSNQPKYWFEGQSSRGEQLPPECCRVT